MNIGTLLQDAFTLFESAVEAELRLDINVRKLSDRDASDIAIQAMDSYMSACSMMMKVLPIIKDKRKDIAIQISKNITFMMNRIELLQVLLNQGGSICKKVKLSDEEIKVQRARARISQPTDSNESKRHRVAMEICETERSYSTSLKKLVDYYVAPLRQQGLVNVNDVFGNIEEILGLSVSFLKELETKINNWSESQTMGDIFKRHAMFFKIYVFYTNGYQKGNSVATQVLRTNERGMEIASAASSAGVQDVTSLMITPVQRLPRYVLLLKELRKRTPDMHPDAQLLESALADIQVVADHVNERLRSHENNARILEIQSQLWTTSISGVPALLQPGRELLKEGTLTKLRRNGLHREVQVFLFNDILVYATMSLIWSGRLHYHNSITFYGASHLDAYEARSQYPSVLHTLDCAFKVTSSEIVRVFVAPTAADCEDWIARINDNSDTKRELDKRRSIGRASYGSVISDTSNPDNGLAELRRRLQES